jgi:2-polyprenyl-3-methyl-5-hydroxy-6-metoxy-1,4-benzoquinol methylase
MGLVPPQQPVGAAYIHDERAQGMQGETRQNRPLTFRQFVSFVKNTPAEKNRPKPYFEKQKVRIYETYRALLTQLPPAASVLSIGAGRAHLECVLAKIHGYRVCVLDFEKRISDHMDQYRAHEIDSEAFNFMDMPPGHLRCSFDCVIFCEIIEHIPLPPPTQIEKILSFMKPQGVIAVTTPNFASFQNVVTLAKGKTLLPSAEKLFSPVGVENESVHRREYTFAEMKQYLEGLGLEVAVSRYAHKTRPGRSAKALVYWAIAGIVPRWRPMLLFIATRPDDGRPLC